MVGSRISVVIGTLNEERNLPFALRSVRPWVDEIVVVDMHSDDKTVDIACEYGARVFFHARVGFVEPARALGFEQASGEWILVLDADEIVPLPLSRVLMRIAGERKADAVRIPFLHYMLGAPLMHANCGPRQCTLPRFFRKQHVRATSTIHNCFALVPGSRVLELRFEPGLAVAHFTYLDSQQFMEKLDRYTGIEAKQALDRGERITPVGALVKAAREFGVRYVKGRGFQDGWRGFYISLFYAFYRVVAAAKLQELTVLGSKEQIESRYRHEAEEILKAYGETQLRGPSAASSVIPTEIPASHG
jgi:glycosyltransferase involved in cell wall biosynthesis